MDTVEKKIKRCKHCRKFYTHVRVIDSKLDNQSFHFPQHSCEMTARDYFHSIRQWKYRLDEYCISCSSIFSKTNPMHLYKMHTICGSCHRNLKRELRTGKRMSTPSLHDEMGIKLKPY